MGEQLAEWLNCRICVRASRTVGFLLKAFWCSPDLSRTYIFTAVGQTRHTHRAINHVSMSGGGVCSPGMATHDMKLDLLCSNGM